MKVHLYFNATIAGHVDIDNLMPDIINRFPDSEITSDTPNFDNKSIIIKDPIKNVTIVSIDKDIDCKIPISTKLSIFQTLGYSYLDICLDIEEELLKKLIKRNKNFLNMIIGSGQAVINGETKDASSILLPTFISIYGQKALSYKENLEINLENITDKLSNFKSKFHIDPLIIGSDLTFALNLSPCIYGTIEDFDNQLEVLSSWNSISSRENALYECNDSYTRICKDKNLLESFDAFNFRYHYNLSIMDKFLSGSKEWLGSLKKDVSNIRENISKDNLNPYYWRELKKRIEVIDLNFLEFNTYVMRMSDLETPDRIDLHLKEEYKKKMVDSSRHKKENLFKYLHEIRSGITNLSTPGHTHDEMFLQQETEKVNERILMLSFIAMSVPAIGALLSPGISNTIKIAAGVSVLLLPLTYLLVRNLIKNIKINKNKRLEFTRIINELESEMIDYRKRIKEVEENKNMPEDFKQQLLQVFSTLIDEHDKQIETLKEKS